jgi:hypothetical protein
MLLATDLMPDEIPAAVQQFVADHIRSIAQLELLLLMHRERQRSWTIADAAKELYTAVSMTEPMLESLRAIGLVSLQGDQYQYAPKSKSLDQTVDDLAQLYQQRRVTIVNLIYSAPVQKLQDFADAFRIRRPPED